MTPPWLPISLSRSGTLAQLTSLIPIVAMIVLVYASSGYGRLFSVYLIIATSVVSIILGLLQKMQGPDSLYYIYDVTNRGGVVGFFANRNHLATLLLATIPFIGALAVSPHRDSKQDDSKIGRLMATGCMALFVAVGVIVVRSSAGWLLLPPVLFASVAVYLRGESGKVPRALLQIGSVIAVICVVASIAAPIKMNDLGDKLSGLDPHMRNQSIRTTAGAALDYLPFGSGGGSFVQVYPRYEDVETASLEYLNHAHDDYVEVALEHGLPGLALIAAAFGLWFVRARKLWRRGEGDALSRAGSIVIAIVFAHSLVDYPLRTAAMAAVAAFAFALMMAPESAEMPGWQSTRRRKHRGKSTRTIDIALAD
jgi:O-antigen ligase